jgi:hypothetical protein
MDIINLCGRPSLIIEQPEALQKQPLLTLKLSRSIEYIHKKIETACTIYSKHAVHYHHIS